VFAIVAQVAESLGTWMVGVLSWRERVRYERVWGFRQEIVIIVGGRSG
jgi:hypothetical protein